MTNRKICWDPTVNRAAWAVLMGIVPAGIDPSQTDKLACEAKMAVPEALTSIFIAGFGDNAERGIVLSIESGTIFLLLPRFQDGEGDGWQGPPRVILDGGATTTDAVEILSRLARHLNVEA